MLNNKREYLFDEKPNEVFFVVGWREGGPIMETTWWSVPDSIKAASSFLLFVLLAFLIVILCKYVVVVVMCVVGVHECIG